MKKPVQLVLERALRASPTRFSRIYWTVVRARKLNIKSAQVKYAANYVRCQQVSNAQAPPIWKRPSN